MKTRNALCVSPERAELSIDPSVFNSPLEALTRQPWPSFGHPAQEVSSDAATPPGVAPLASSTLSRSLSSFAAIRFFIRAHPRHPWSIKTLTKPAWIAVYWQLSVFGFPSQTRPDFHPSKLSTCNL